MNGDYTRFVCIEIEHLIFPMNSRFLTMGNSLTLLTKICSISMLWGSRAVDLGHDAHAGKLIIKIFSKKS